MSAPIVMISRFPLLNGGASHLQEELEIEDSSDLQYFFDMERAEMLQLRAFSSLADLDMVRPTLEAECRRFADVMSGDVRRELLMFVEAPKPCGTPLPDTPYIQLRHVEVPPNRMVAYRDWREKTIFDVVRSASAIEVFLAYHSIVSSQPGVMFLSGFSGSTEDYLDVFGSPRYTEIVRQAGTSYITGGEGGLYTRLFHRVSAIKAGAVQ